MISLKAIQILVYTKTFQTKATITRVATETAKSNSRTFLGHFPGLFKVFLLDLKFNIDYYSFMYLLFSTCD